MKENEELIQASIALIEEAKVFADKWDNFSKLLKITDLKEYPRPVPLSLLRAYSLYHDFETDETISDTIEHTLNRLYSTTRQFGIPDLVTFSLDTDDVKDDGSVRLLTDKAWELYGENKKAGDIVDHEGTVACIVWAYKDPMEYDGCIHLVEAKYIDPEK